MVLLDYLVCCGWLVSVVDLLGYNCIGFWLIVVGSFYDWELCEVGVMVVVCMMGSVVIIDVMFVCELVLVGVGIVYVFEFLVCEVLCVGWLV